MMLVVMDSSAHAFFLDRFASIYPFSHCVWRIPEAATQASFGSFVAPMLDLGCGDGTYFAIMLDRLGRPIDPSTGTLGDVYGIDPLAEELVKAEKRGVYTKLFHGMSNAIPLPSESVNTVFSNSVVEHIADKDGTIREVARILRSGGRYLFSAPSQNFALHFRFRGWLERVFGARVAQAWVDVINRKFIHHWIQSPEQWGDDLAKHGLVIDSFRYTLSPENAATWERYLIPSFAQHIPAKRFGWVPCSRVSRRALTRRFEQLLEPDDLSKGGNVVILARKP